MRLSFTTDPKRLALGGLILGAGLTIVVRGTLILSGF